MDALHTAEDWVSVFSSATDYEADLVRDRLADAGVDAVVHSQRDHAFNLTVGELAQTHVMVPRARADEAAALIDAPAMSDADLEEAALSSDPLAPDATTPANEARSDSGADTISFDVPGDGDDEAAPLPGAPLG